MTMKRSTLISPIIVLAFILALQLSPVTQASAPVSGGNVPFDHILTPTEDDIHLYLGMDESFDQALVNLSLQNLSETPADLVWEYRTEGGSWKPLSGTETDLRPIGVTQTQSITFTEPSDWKRSNHFGTKAFWVRAKVVNASVSFEDFMARSYNVQLHVQNEIGDAISFLNNSHFSLELGSDNTIYGVRNLGNGDYALALQTEASDLRYMVLIDAKEYLQKGVQFDLAKTDGTIQRTVEINLNASCINPFGNLDHHWAKGEIHDSYCRGTVQKTDALETEDPITREEFVEMTLNTASINPEPYGNLGHPFLDVEEENDAISTAYQTGMTNLTENFRPNDEITRAEAVAMVVRLSGTPMVSVNSGFTDIESTEWFAKEIRVAETYKVAEGYLDGTFRPFHAITRAEATMLLENAWHTWFYWNQGQN